jgi:hypothetical protein
MDNTNGWVKIKRKKTRRKKPYKPSLNEDEKRKRALKRRNREEQLNVRMEHLQKDFKQIYDVFDRFDNSAYSPSQDPESGWGSFNYQKYISALVDAVGYGEAMVKEQSIWRKIGLCPLVLIGEYTLCKCDNYHPPESWCIDFLKHGICKNQGCEKFHAKKSTV